MPGDHYSQGYQQASYDFSAGQDYKPHKIKNMFGLVMNSSKNNDEFLNGYKDGWNYCKRQSLQREARELLQESGPSVQTRSSPNRLDLLNQARRRLNEAPEHEPEY